MHPNAVPPIKAHQPIFGSQPDQTGAVLYDRIDVTGGKSVLDVDPFEIETLGLEAECEKAGEEECR
jgi:hypothetical protein